jgi:hypothetical protein
MLVSNSKYAVGDIIAVKLVNGDEVVGKLTTETDTEYLLDKPCVIVGSAKGIALIQAMFSLAKDKSISVKKEHIIMTCEAMAEMRDHYTEVTTGIKPVTAGSIIT